MWINVHELNGGDLRIGKKLGSYLCDAGFTDVRIKARYEVYPSLDFIGESLALQLEKAGQPEHAECLRAEVREQKEKIMIRYLPTFALVFAMAVSAQAEDQKDSSEKKLETKTENESAKKEKGLVLFDGKSLAGWKSTNFGGEAEVSVKDGAIHLPEGSDMTGITWKDAKKIPTSNYILEVEAQRVDGSDFFCGLTFPLGKDPCSLILGGWGGGVCGLSSINGFDASENETTIYREFKNQKWYKVKLQVDGDRVQVWLDGKNIIDQPREDRMFSIRLECELSRPLGFATWRTSGALRKLKMRKMTAAEIKKSKAEHIEKAKNE